MPLLSIIVPVYNKYKYVNSCINSILSQTFKDFELILIDDGSTDGSSSICNYYGDLDKRVRVFHQSNKGVSSARNKGIDESIGTYIGYVDADDIIEPDMFELLINNIIKSQADISICSMKLISPYKTENKFSRTAKIKIYNKDEAMALFLQGKLFWSANNKIFNSKIAKQIKFEGTVNEDIFYNFLAFTKANKIIFQDTIKYKYMVRNNSQTISKFNLRFLETIKISQKMVDFVSKNMSVHVEDAKVLDFSKNISLLNLFLLINRREYDNEFKMVVQNLSNYSEFLKISTKISLKQRYAYSIFKFSSHFYSVLLRIYCSIFAKDLLKITENSQN